MSKGQFFFFHFEVRTVTAITYIPLHCIKCHSIVINFVGVVLCILFLISLNETEHAEDMIDHRSYAHNLSSCEINPFAVFLFSFTCFRKLLTKSWPRGRMKMKV